MQNFTEAHSALQGRQEELLGQLQQLQKCSTGKTEALQQLEERCNSLQEQQQEQQTTQDEETMTEKLQRADRELHQKNSEIQDLTKLQATL